MSGSEKVKVDGGLRIAFRTKSKLEILDDGYKWRKYGKKSLKNNPNPRYGKFDDDALMEGIHSGLDVTKALGSFSLCHLTYLTCETKNYKAPQIALSPNLQDKITHVIFKIFKYHSPSVSQVRV
ncbi:putative WRKY transcription factor 51 [Acorus gramineus]|uniref:WRKY transcription factor 51 n=1 Tax=Acorus gramineus TaxID=55184 RepID=A0AAV9A4N6_ACOGR|nr:putative WRKY transcription factor 51 [Acorus gramineus]